MEFLSPMVKPNLSARVDMSLRRLFLLLLLTTCLCQPEGLGQHTNAPENSKLPKALKRKSIDDIEEIGSRNIGNSGLGNWYSLDKELVLGRDFADKLEASSRLIDDPVITEYVNRIGQNLVRNSDAKIPFAIKVIDSDEVNAFALPGGFLYVNSGLILAAEDEAELAGVMAHEIAHVAARHATRQMTRSEMFSLASIPLIFVGGGVGFAVQQAAGLATPLTMLKFSRGFEAEADYLGIEYLYKAGYDPEAMITFFEKIKAQEKVKPGLIAKAFAEHPQTSDRIKKTQKEIGTILPPQEVYRISSSEFDAVKDELRSLERRNSLNSQQPDRPTLLRRASEQTTVPEPDEDRPKLKRRSD